MNKSNWKWDRGKNEEFLVEIRMRKAVLGDNSYPDIIKTAKKTFRILKVLYNGWKWKDSQKRDIITKLIKSNFILSVLTKCFEEDDYKKTLISKSTIKLFFKNSNIDLRKKTVDFYAVYLGNAGILGHLKEKSISLARCFFLEDFGVDDLISLLKKEAKNIKDEKEREEFESITEKDIVQYLYPKEVENQNIIADDSTTKKIDEIHIGVDNIEKILREQDKYHLEKIEKLNPNYNNPKKLNDAIKNIKKRVLTKNELEFSEWFDTIITTQTLSEEQNIEINQFFKSKFKWYHRAMLASALTLSILTEWNEEKVEFLKDLAVIDNNEVLVSERAIIGLVISLIVSFEIDDQFQKTLRIMRSLKNNFKYVAGIYETLNYFSTKYKKDAIDKIVSDNYLFIERKGFQFFEPPHSNVSYISFKNLSFDKKEDEQRFFKLLSSTIYYSRYKDIILLTLNEATTESNKTFLEIRNAEKKVSMEFEKKYPSFYIEMKYNNFLDDFMIGLVHFEQLKKFLRIENINKKYLFQSVFEEFSYHRFATLLPTNIVFDGMKFKNKKTYFDLGDILDKAGKEKDALISYNEAINKNPKHKRALFNKASLLQRMEEKDKSLEVYNLLTDIFPKFTKAWCAKANLLRNMNEYNKAIEAYDIATILKPKNALAWYYKGETFSIMNKPKEAILCFEKAVKFKKKNGNYWAILGQKYLDINKFEDAIFAYRKAIECDESYAGFRVLLGIALNIMNRNEEAIFSIKKAIALDDKDIPNDDKNYELWHFLGQLYFEEKDYEEALDTFIKALSFKVDSLECLDDIERTLKRINKKNKEPFFKRLLNFMTKRIRNLF